MGKLVIIDGIESFKGLNFSDPNLFTFAKLPDGNFEVLLGGRGARKGFADVRRMALCSNENDAECIVDALRAALKAGVI